MTWQKAELFDPNVISMSLYGIPRSLCTGGKTIYRCVPLFVKIVSLLILHLLISATSHQLYLLYLEMKEWEMYPEKIPKPKKETSLNEENDTRTYQSSLGLSASPWIFLKRENHATSSLLWFFIAWLWPQPESRLYQMILNIFTPAVSSFFVSIFF